MHVQEAWERRPQLPHEAFRDLLDPTIFPFPWFILALIALITGLVAASWRVAGAAAGAYATACLVVITSAGWLGSSMRHELAIFPAFLVLGALTERRWAHILWTTASALIASVFAVMFALWYWVS